jgi:DNA-binding response OmpR family regulator
VLLAEDDEAFRHLLQGYLARRGFEVQAVSNGSELLATLTDLMLDGEGSIDVLVSDICMPNWSGVQVLNGLRCAGCALPVILITASTDRESEILASELSARLLHKPFELEELVRALEAIDHLPH